MYQLTKKQAQQIVNKMMKDIPYNINIMDKQGVIIGSGNKDRIGTLHQGAVEAIQLGKIVEIQTDKQFEKKGINLPIEMNGDILGVVGISGDVEETRPFGNLVKSTVILLIEQSETIQKENREKENRQDFFNLLINPDTVYTKEIISQAKFYHINLEYPVQIIYLELPFASYKEISVLSHFPSFKFANHLFYIVIQNPTNFASLIRQIQDLYSDAFIAISKSNDTIYEGYKQSRSAMRVMKGLFPNEKIIFYKDCAFIASLSEFLLHDRKEEQYLKVLEKDEELIKTLQVYIQCNLNVSQTASRLIIHRNTLHYRLERIHKITGKDPKNILGLLELTFMLINRI
nr:sugar diacid recognition domain-containing protein [uncultured Bacillus sp.]